MCLAHTGLPVARMANLGLAAVVLFLKSVLPLQLDLFAKSLLFEGEEV